MIYVARADGKVIGKFSEQEFRAKISAGDISPNDQYLGDGTRQWIRASEFPGATFPKPDPREQVLPGTAWPPSAKVCTNCGYVRNPISITRGAFAIEVLLWLFFLVPGIIYSVWRLTSRYAACPKCKAKERICSTFGQHRAFSLVLGAGLEPACLSAYAPQTYVSAIPPPERMKSD